MSNPTSLYLLRTDSTPKIGQRANGHVHYQVLADTDRQQLFIRLTANDGGGYFSRELVSFASIQHAIANQDASTPFPSKQFRDVFRGKSSNNAGFLACVLRAEGLLSGVPDKTHQHLLAGDWSAWETSLLAEPGELIEIGSNEAAPSSADTVNTPSPSPRKKGKGSKVPAAGDPDADPS